MLSDHHAIFVGSSDVDVTFFRLVLRIDYPHKLFALVIWH
ncbi:Uncharacterised protein [Vibrio cholerae]|nr:Uncharacterised protein [Vibrio cholerae]